MRNIKSVKNILSFTGKTILVFGFLLFIPLITGIFLDNKNLFLINIKAFFIPGILSVITGFVLNNIPFSTELSEKESMLLCPILWLVVSGIGAVPFVIILKISYLNAFFEAMSGFTTTGITMLSGIDFMPKGILLWRALTQWLGGLGILSFFLVFSFKGAGISTKLFSAESHKIKSERLKPGIYNTIKVLWMIYAGFTIAQTLILMQLGLGFFDAITHAFTTSATGGYSIYDNSVMHYRTAHFTYYRIIEYVFIFFMLAGSINFLIHYRILSGKFSDLWRSTEIKYFWFIIFFSVLIVMLSNTRTLMDADSIKNFTLKLEESFRTAMFQVVSIITTTGYTTKGIMTSYFSAASKQLFLILMIIGGMNCSTGGGIKVFRVAILFKLLKREIYKTITGRLSRAPVVINKKIVGSEEILRVAAIFFGWIILLAAGGFITACFSDLGSLQAFSGMCSALGNIGPCYITVNQMIHISPVVKITYIIGMLAGRLELLPVLIMLNYRVWK